jgi:hypothetical protein
MVWACVLTTAAVMRRVLRSAPRRMQRRLVWMLGFMDVSFDLEWFEAVCFAVWV